MTGKELVIEALRNHKTPRAPWVPFVGVHGGHLVGANAEDYLKSADLLVAGQKKACELYQADGIPVAFDLQMEAEVLGCELEWALEGPPSVSSHPFENGLTLADLPEFSVDKGRFPMVMEATRRLKQDVGETTTLYGLLCGPYTLALHLYGNNIFLEMFDNEAGVQEVVAFCAEIGKQVADAYLANGCDVIAVVDPMTSQISPDHFETFVAGPLNSLFDHVNAQGAYSSLFVCGDATRNLEAMSQTSCHNLSVDENVDLNYLVELARKYHKSVGGNLQLTLSLLMGSEVDCQADALRCLDAGGDTGFILAPGCDLPYAVPPKNMQAVATLVHDKYARDVARTVVAGRTDTDSYDDVQPPDYATADRVIVDVVSLDSGSCAPCQYMVQAVRKAAEQIGETGVEWHEHKITTRDGLGYMSKLGVEKIPSICINGVPTFASIIPDQTALVEAIQAQR
jgi:uroporphyrinogen decarboxylase